MRTKDENYGRCEAIKNNVENLHSTDRMEGTKTENGNVRMPIEEKNHDLENFVELQLQNEKCFDNSLIDFSYFPMKGEILMEVLDSNKLGIKEIKELTC